MRRIVHEGGPVWGVCLGAQLLALAAGGDVYKRKTPEVGWVSIEKVADDPLLRGISSPFVAFSWHAYSCSVPATSHLIARAGDGVQAFRAGGRAWATQFHPEIDAAMAPHWVEDAAKEHHEQGKGWIERLRARHRHVSPRVSLVLPHAHRELRAHERARFPPTNAGSTQNGGACAPPSSPVSGQPLGERGL